MKLQIFAPKMKLSAPDGPGRRFVTLLCDLIDFVSHDISSIFNYDKTLLSMQVDRNNMSQFCSIKSIQEFNIFIIQFKRIAV